MANRRPYFYRNFKLHLAGSIVYLHWPIIVCKVARTIADLTGRVKHPALHGKIRAHFMSRSP